jgi:DNA-binding transcriptional LysR family regulator
MWITLEQIQYLKEVSQTGSVTKAAEKLLRAKSAVTKSIQNLEEQVGFPLLDRSDYRAKLTPQGKSFLYKAEDVLYEVEQLKHACAQITSRVETKLSISVSGIYESHKFYSVIKQATEKFPQTQITLHKETLSGEKMLFDEIADIAIFERIRNQRDLDFKLLGTTELRLVIASDHPYLETKSSQRTIQGLYKYPQIIQRSSLAKDEVSYGVHKNSIKWFVTDTASKKDIIVNGLGWGRLPWHEIKNELKSGQLTHLKELKDDDSIEFFVAKRKNFDLGQVAQFIWDRVT